MITEQRFQRCIYICIRRGGCTPVLPYFCLFAIFLSRYIDIFSLSFVAENYGEYLTASVIIGDSTSLMWRLLGLFYEYDPKSSQLVWVKKYVHERHTPTGCPIYDFFMGTILYPRIGNVDVKMIAEARWSWLLLLSLHTLVPLSSTKIWVMHRHKWHWWC